MGPDNVAVNMNSILQIYLEELNSEKEQVALFRGLHHGKITSFRGKIFSAGAVIAAFLAAVMALNIKDLINPDAAHFITRYFWGFFIFLVADISIIVLAELLFAKHILISRVSWFKLEDQYDSMIHHIDKIRIFLASKSEVDKMDAHQLCILVSYDEVINHIY